jgi:hypothetical protein
VSISQDLDKPFGPGAALNRAVQYAQLADLVPYDGLEYAIHLANTVYGETHPDHDMDAGKAGLALLHLAIAVAGRENVEAGRPTLILDAGLLCGFELGIAIANERFKDPKGAIREAFERFRENVLEEARVAAQERTAV